MFDFLQSIFSSMSKMLVDPQNMDWIGLRPINIILLIFFAMIFVFFAQMQGRRAFKKIRDEMEKSDG